MLIAANIQVIAESVRITLPAVVSQINKNMLIAANIQVIAESVRMTLPAVGFPPFCATGSVISTSQS